MSNLARASMVSPVPSDTSHRRSNYILPPLRVGPRGASTTVHEPRPSFSTTISIPSSGGHTHGSPSLDGLPRSGGILLSPPLGSTVSLARGQSRRSNGHVSRKSADSIDVPATARPSHFARSLSTTSTMASRVSEDTERDDDSLPPLPSESPSILQSPSLKQSPSINQSPSMNHSPSILQSPTMPQASVSTTAVGIAPTSPTKSASNLLRGSTTTLASIRSASGATDTSSKTNGIRRLGSLLRK